MRHGQVRLPHSLFSVAAQNADFQPTVRLWIFDHYKNGLNVPKEGEDSSVWSRFDKWLKAIEERPSVRETTSEKEKYLSIYQKYADDKAQSELAKATRKGRGVP